MKTCSKCKESKGLTEFFKNKRNKDGLNLFCKACEKARKNSKEYQEGYAAYYEKNKDKVLANSKEYYYNNRENVNRRHSEYSKNNPEIGRKSRKEHYWRNRDKLLEGNREYRYMRNYGLTLERFDEMRLEQNHRCFICHTHETEERLEVLNVDHDHETGEVRKLLCSLCNKGLGLFKDSPALLENAASYLRLHGKS